MTLRGCTCPGLSQALCPLCTALAARAVGLTLPAPPRHATPPPPQPGRPPRALPSPEGLTVVLPYPPSLNHLYPTVGRRRVLSKAGKDYHRVVAMAVQATPCRIALPMRGRLRFALEIVCPDRRRRDILNLPKIIEDSLVRAGVMDDDSQIDRAVIERQVIPGEQYVTVTVAPSQRGATPVLTPFPVTLAPWLKEGASRP